MAEDEPNGKKQKVSHSNFGHELGINIVDIYVGPSKQVFRVHKELLCSKVDYFKKMFESGFKEGVEQAATLPEDDPDAFALFLQWLYKDFCTPIDISKHNSQQHDVFFVRIRLYCFAEKICLPLLMDYIMTTILSTYAKNSKFPSLRAMALTYQLSAHGSKLRTFAARSLAYVTVTSVDVPHWSSAGIAATLMTSLDLTQDLMNLLRATTGKPVEHPLRKFTNCAYHTHLEGEACRFQDRML